MSKSRHSIDGLVSDYKEYFIGTQIVIRNESMWILIVDDEKDVRESLREILIMAGYDVATASSGKEALDFMITQDLSMMLVDFSIPGMTGEDI